MTSMCSIAPSERTRSTFFMNSASSCARMAGRISIMSVSSAPLVRGDLLQASDVPHVPGEPRFKPDLHQPLGERWVLRDGPASEAEHVGIVMLARHPRGVAVIDERGARAAYLVRGDALADAASAEDDRHRGAARPCGRFG